MNGGQNGNNSSNPPSISGSKSVLYPEQISFTEKTPLKSKTEKFLLFLTVLLLLALVVFIALFVVYFIKYDDAESKAENLCNTPDCVESAASMLKRMNLAADPCQDFAEFACGRFISESVMPEGRTRISTFSVLHDDNQVILRAIIEEDDKPGDPQYLVHMKNSYRACMDEAQIEKIGLEPYLNDTAWAHDYPTLNPSWDPATFNLKELIAKYETKYVEPLFSYHVSIDLKDSNRKLIYFNDGSLGLSQEYLRRERNDSVLLAYERFVAETSIILGADRATALQDARDLVELERALAEIMVPREERRDSSRLYNPTTLEELDADYPEFGIASALRAAFATVNVSLANDEPIINRFPTYIGNLSMVINNFDNRVIQNLFASFYARYMVRSLTKDLRAITLDFEKVYNGRKEESPRWEVCLGSASNDFWKAMSKEYVQRSFSETAKDYMNEMIDNLKDEMRGMIEELSWMSQKTKQAAYDKLRIMHRKIGYPDNNFSSADLEEKYKNYEMDPKHFYNNRVLIREIANMDGLRSLREPVDKTEWRMSPYEVNAYFARSENEIVFPAGILQPPFFSQTFKDARNYGGIGVVIGHEITHGFDDQGSQYDAEGNLRNWWQDSDRSNFLKRTKCIVDQYSNFHVDHVNMSLRGINLQGESVADLGGVKESFRAYKQLVKEKGEQPALPGLGFTNNQIFFLSYAQLWCDRMTSARWINQIVSGVHPPGKYRIIGPLQNNEEFAQAFNCPRGSYMNPEDKCVVW